MHRDVAVCHCSWAMLRSWAVKQQSCADKGVSDLLPAPPPYSRPLQGAYNCAAAAYPHMKAAGHGKVHMRTLHDPPHRPAVNLTHTPAPLRLSCTAAKASALKPPCP